MKIENDSFSPFQFGGCKYSWGPICYSYYAAGIFGCTEKCERGHAALTFLTARAAFVSARVSNLFCKQGALIYALSGDDSQTFSRAPNKTSFARCKTKVYNACVCARFFSPTANFHSPTCGIFNIFARVIVLFACISGDFGVWKLARGLLLFMGQSRPLSLHSLVRLKNYLAANELNTF